MTWAGDVVCWEPLAGNFKGFTSREMNDSIPGGVMFPANTKNITSAELFLRVAAQDSGMCRLPQKNILPNVCFDTLRCTFSCGTDLQCNLSVKFQAVAVYGWSQLNTVCPEPSHITLGDASKLDVSVLCEAWHASFDAGLVSHQEPAAEVLTHTCVWATIKLCNNPSTGRSVLVVPEWSSQVKVAAGHSCCNDSLV